MWAVRTDPRRTEEISVALRFDAVVAPGGERLNGPGRELDLVAAKVRAVIAGLLGTGWCSTGPTLRLDHRDHLQFIRWRLASGFRTVASLTPDAFDLFCSDLCKQGNEGIVPVTRRVAEYFAENGAERLIVPVPGYPTRKPSLARLARHVGVDNPCSLPPRAKALINAMLGLELPERELEEDGPGSAEVPVRLSAKRLTVVIRVWQRAWELRGRMPFDPLGFDPFEVTTAASIAATIGVKTERTPDIPPLQACFVLERALRWVHDYSEDILSWLEKVLKSAFSTDTGIRPQRVGSEIARLAAIEPTQPPPPGENGAHWPIDPVYARDGWSSCSSRSAYPTFKTLVYKLLPSACMIVLASFTLRRKADLLGIRSGCTSADVDGPWIEIFSSKGHRDFRRTPATASVVRALDIMRALSAAAGPSDEHRSVWLFRELAGQGLLFGFNPNAIRDFAAHIGLPDVPGGGPWRLTYHQIRRYAIFAYYYRYEYAELAVISEAAGHGSTRETEHYLTKNVPGAYGQIADQVNAARLLRDRGKETDPAREFEVRVFVEVEQDYIMHTCTRAASGEVPLEGLGGKFIMAELALLKEAAAKATVISTSGKHEGKSFTDGLKDWAKGQRLHPHAAYSSCRCGVGKLDLIQAECLKRKELLRGKEAAAADTLPDRSYADVYTCGKCAHGVRRPENVAAIRRLRDEQLLVAARGSSQYLRERARENAVSIGQFLPGSDTPAGHGERD